jgi:hypothetical protein
MKSPSNEHKRLITKSNDYKSNLTTSRFQNWGKALSRGERNLTFKMDPLNIARARNACMMRMSCVQEIG